MCTLLHSRPDIMFLETIRTCFFTDTTTNRITEGLLYTQVQQHFILTNNKNIEHQLTNDVWLYRHNHKQQYSKIFLLGTTTVHLTTTNRRVFIFRHNDNTKIKDFTFLQQLQTVCLLQALSAGHNKI